ncbi:MAG: DUF4097 family beta strand repeat-containing protein [Gemmatimonadales bacterium]
MQAIVILTALLLPATLLRAQQAERYVMADDEVAIYNLAGKVSLEPGTGGELSVQVTRGGADAAQLKVGHDKRDGVETLRLIYPGNRIRYGAKSTGGGSSTQIRVRDDGTFGDDSGHQGKKEGRSVTIASSGGGLDARADLRIGVPSGRQVSVYLAMGEVSISNVSGTLHIDAASAPVNATNTRGELEIDVGSGPVQVTQSRGDLSVDTGSGGVTVSDVRGEQISIETGSGDVSATNLNSKELSISTGSGNIEVTSLTAPQVALETGSGSVTADLSGEIWSVKVETGSGDVTLKVPPTLAAEVDIETSSGDIETDFEVAVTRHARDHMTGRIGEGGGKIDIESGSGGIKLVKGK